MVDALDRIPSNPKRATVRVARTDAEWMASVLGYASVEEMQASVPEKGDVFTQLANARKP